jgi:hypothetical protein
MKIEPFGTELIERYLRSRRRQYFHGRHDGEYFFIVKTDYAKLHIYLEIPFADRETLTIRVTPARFHPSSHRGRLMKFAVRWNRRDAPAKAIVYRSSDPTRVGVTAQSDVLIGRRIGFGDFAAYVDHTIASAIELFGKITSPGEHPPTRACPPVLRDAG